MSSAEKSAISIATIPDDSWIQGDKCDVTGEGVHILQLWATWCPPCRNEIPRLNKLANILKDDAKLIGLSGEEKNAITRQNVCGMQYRSIADATAYKKYSSEFGIRGIPHAFIIRDGSVKFSGHPHDDEFLTKLSEAIGRDIKEDDLLEDAVPAPSTHTMISGEVPNTASEGVQALVFASSLAEQVDSLMEAVSQLAERLVSFTSFSFHFTDSADSAENARSAAAQLQIATGLDTDAAWCTALNGGPVPDHYMAVVRNGKVVASGPAGRVFRQLFGVLAEVHGEEPVLAALNSE